MLVLSKFSLFLELLQCSQCNGFFHRVAAFSGGVVRMMVLSLKRSKGVGGAGGFFIHASTVRFFCLKGIAK